jgi:hypothetical protein
VEEALEGKKRVNGSGATAAQKRRQRHGGRAGGWGWVGGGLGRDPGWRRPWRVRRDSKGQERQRRRSSNGVTGRRGGWTQGGGGLEGSEKSQSIGASAARKRQRRHGGRWGGQGGGGLRGSEGGHKVRTSAAQKRPRRHGGGGRGNPGCWRPGRVRSVSGTEASAASLGEGTQDGGGLGESEGGQRVGASAAQKRQRRHRGRGGGTRVEEALEGQKR